MVFLRSMFKECLVQIKHLISTKVQKLGLSWRICSVLSEAWERNVLIKLAPMETSLHSFRFVIVSE
jgi:hypothetical protein